MPGIMEEELIDNPETEKKPQERLHFKGHEKDWMGATLGMFVFLAGVGILVWVFKMSLEMFTTPPRVSLDIKTGQTIDLAHASDKATAILVRVVLLVLMSITGSLIANRGIHLYSACTRRIKVL